MLSKSKSQMIIQVWIYKLEDAKMNNSLKTVSQSCTLTCWIKLASACHFIYKILANKMRLSRYMLLMELSNFFNSILFRQEPALRWKIRIVLLQSWFPFLTPGAFLHVRVFTWTLSGQKQTCETTWLRKMIYSWRNIKVIHDLLAMLARSLKNLMKIVSMVGRIR